MSKALIGNMKREPGYGVNASFLCESCCDTGFVPVLPYENDHPCSLCEKGRYFADDIGESDEP